VLHARVTTSSASFVAPRAGDVYAYHLADPLGFLVARLRRGVAAATAAEEAEAEPVGCVAAVRCGERHGFLGFFLVAPQWRRRGVGAALWRAATARLAGRLVGLDAVPAAAARYERDGGFRAAARAVRHVGAAPDAHALAQLQQEEEEQEACATSGAVAFQIVDAARVPFDSIAACDARTC
jgi:predicted N-acetyltransferase YhbS